MRPASLSWAEREVSSVLCKSVTRPGSLTPGFDQSRIRKSLRGLFKTPGGQMSDDIPPFADPICVLAHYRNARILLPGSSSSLLIPDMRLRALLC
jgi:hypothetical protein